MPEGRRTEVQPLGTNSEKEIETKGMHRCIVDFSQQMGITDDIADKQLVWVRGDGGSFAAINRVKKHLAGVELKPVESCENIFATPEVWHSRSTYLNTDASNHFRESTSSDPSSLSRAANVAGMHRPTDLKSCDFYPTSRTMNLCWFTQVLSTWIVYLDVKDLVVHFDAWPLPADLRKLPTSSPVIQRDGNSTYIDSFDPGDIMYEDTGRDLSSETKRAIDALIAKLRPADRSIINHERGLHFCHLMEKSMNEAQVEFLSKEWKRNSRISLSAVDNIIKLQPTEHVDTDNAGSSLIPQTEVIEKIYNLFTADPKRAVTAEDLDEFFVLPKRKDNFRTFRYLPLRVDQKKRISCHKLDSGPNGTWESTGEYQYYYWPYDKLTMRTHANPLKSIWHAGKELAKLHGEELVALVNDLEDVGSDLSTAIRYITTLYRRWNPDLNKKVPSTKEQKDPVTEAAPDSIPAQWSRVAQMLQRSTKYLC
ncbi:hypothetical protein C8J56DRAFT_1039291 [Mycena floridula]|nr:hypothetical protein C8J56DRAFT_1039291 [Mycena floridula]